jgi:hypothetical protein
MMMWNIQYVFQATRKNENKSKTQNPKNQKAPQKS